MKISLNINNAIHDVDVDPAMPLLWVLRDELGLTGTKYGCGIGSCGACTVMIDGRAVRSCVVRAGSTNGSVITIEGIGSGDAPHAVQTAWIQHQVAQCGYCQPGQIMAAIALLARHPEPDDQNIDIALHGNLCRCGTYPHIRDAIKAAAALLRDRGKTERIEE